MAQSALQDGAWIPTLATSYTPSHQTSAGAATTSSHNSIEWQVGQDGHNHGGKLALGEDNGAYRSHGLGSTGKGILIGMLSAFGSAALVGLVVAIIYFFRYTSRGRILLDRIGRPGEFDDEQQFLREEEEALAEMDDLQRAEYQRAKCKSCVSVMQGWSFADRRYSFRTGEPARIRADGYLVIAVPRNTREGRVGVGV